MNLESILLVDDHAMFRTGLSLVILDKWPSIDVKQASSVQEALLFGAIQPVIVLLDIHLVGQSGLEGITLMKKQWPSVPVVMLSAEDGATTQSAALSCGAACFVSKAEPAAKILQVIASVVNESTGSATFQLQAQNADQKSAQLTRRQREVLDLVSQGLPNKTIGRKLFLSENTIRGHVQAILTFFQASSRSEAVYQARRGGILK